VPQAASTDFWSAQSGRRPAAGKMKQTAHSAQNFFPHKYPRGKHLSHIQAPETYKRKYRLAAENQMPEAPAGYVFSETAAMPRVLQSRCI